MIPFASYVALGDSWTEGVGDPDPGSPNGVRGWADRVAEVLASQSDEFRYANLAIRGRRTPEIIDEQVEPALVMKPELVTFQSGGNDVFRPSVDIDAIVAGIDDVVARFRAQGSTVVLFTHGNGGTSGVIGRLRGRLAIFNELLREVVDRHDAVLVDNWRVPEGRDLRYWDADRIHLSPAGHQRAAMYVLDALGLPHDLTAPELDPLPVLSRRERRYADTQWAKDHLLPWAKRRVAGRSLGDGVSPKYPTLTPFPPREF